MNKLTLDSLPSLSRRFLVRVDFNVPLETGRVADDTRLVAALPTVRKILGSGGSTVLLSHLGRPKGAPEARYSLAPVASRLAELLGLPVAFAPDCLGAEAQRMAGALGKGQVLLLENLRFHPGEEADDPTFARALAVLGEGYVNDAFGAAHRAHASTSALPRLFKDAAAGYLMETELKYLGLALTRPERPFVAILGGAKVSGKIDVLTHLLHKVDKLLVGGGMAFTFLAAQGVAVGRSLVEPDRLEVAKRLLSGEGSQKIVLPVDCVVATNIDTAAGCKVVTTDRIPPDAMGLDIGPATVDRFCAALDGCRTIIWNGPMGVFEKEAFAGGTIEVARAVANATDRGATSIIGGGDSAAAVSRTGTGSRMSHISTGGGASLEFLEGKVLPGVAALADRLGA